MPHRQSPIRIFKGGTLPLPNTSPVFSYATGVTREGNKFFPVEPATMVWGDRMFDLDHFHYHQPSEHILGNGPAHAAECHLVHKERGNANSLLVCGVFLDPATEGGSHAGALAGDADALASLDLRQLVPESGTYFTYAGSLTTPPYTENVRWLVFETPLNLPESGFPFQDARPCQRCNNEHVFVGNVFSQQLKK